MGRRVIRSKRADCLTYRQQHMADSLRTNRLLSPVVDDTDGNQYRVRRLRHAVVIRGSGTCMRLSPEMASKLASILYLAEDISAH